MASEINDWMVAIGKTCLKTFRLTKAVYWHSWQWRAEGTIETLMGILQPSSTLVRWKKRKVWGVAEPPPNPFKRKAKWTTLMIVDSQAVKKTCNAKVDSQGFCHYKCVNGSKRHLAVDTRSVSVFYSLYPSSCVRWPGLNPNVES